MKRYTKRALVFTYDETVEALSQYLERHHQASPKFAMNLELTFENGAARLEWETEEEKVDLT